jgi:hypothetical protein
MKGLLLRLSALDADAENAVRVISFFDQLIAGRATLHALVRETARLAECPAAVADEALGVSLRADTRGNVDPAGPRRPEIGAAVRDLSPHSRVWLERPPGAALPLDDIVLERFAIACALLLDHTRAPAPVLGDTALVELALSTASGETERARALRLMHLDPVDPLHALAVAGPTDAVASLVELLGLAEPWARTASLNHAHAILTRSLPPELPDALAGRLRIGVGPALPALQAPASWQQARIALRFAKLGHLYPAVVRADTLGALSVISTTLCPADIARVADVAALDRIAAAPNGVDTLTVLTVLCAAGSVRQAATRLYRHHSTLAARIALAETRLGFCPTTPAGRSRLELAILLRHLRDTPE